jgi:hypothetical protein
MSELYKRDTLLKDLRNNLVEIHFIKSNGEQRVMRCTLQKHMLPESYQRNLEEQAEEKKFHKENPDVIAVWDLEAMGWRSFRVDSVVYCEVKGHY